MASSVYNIEEIRWGNLNLRVLLSTEVLKIDANVPYPSSIVLLDDACITIVLASFD